MNDSQASPSWCFERLQTVRFGHCDPAGIVFYPRYFEMLNELVEDWFNQGLGIDFGQLHGPRRVGMPTVSLHTDFRRVSRIGDPLRQRLALLKLGRSSLSLQLEFCGAADNSDVRVQFRQVLVCTCLDTHRAQAFPNDLRAALERAAGAAAV